MKIIKIIIVCILTSLLTNCASGYQIINPKDINYVSKHEAKNIKFEYKYELLDKKYAKKEIKKGIKLVAIKITNNSEEDLIFGKDLTLTFENDSEINIMNNDNVFKSLKQSSASYLFYLLLTPLNLYTTNVSSNGIETNSFPIGLFIGPGLAGGNLIAAASANKKFKEELLDYNINGTIIKKGETKHGLIGFKTNSFEALKLKFKQ